MDNKDFLTEIELPNRKLTYYSLPKLSHDFSFDLESMPYSLRILLENLIRNFDNKIVDEDLIKKFISDKKEKFEIPFRPARVILQDFTGVPCIDGLAAMRDVVAQLGGDTNSINPNVPVDLVIDLSLIHI